jgi:UDP-N-acetylmuramate dehydrogenase
MISDWNGRLLEDKVLAPFTWFRVGGPVSRLATPYDEAALSSLLAATEGPVMAIGVGSNLLVRDGGIDGTVIRLGRGFNDITVEGTRIRAGAAALDAKVASAAADAGIAGLEFLRGVPGTIGGAVRMNAGCYGTETKDRLIEARVALRDGTIQTYEKAELGFAYRHCDLPEDAVVIEATFEGIRDDPVAIHDRMTTLMTNREASQPIREKTGGSTFRNPPGESAWKLVDAAGGRGLRVGGAQMSEKHCNFMINTGDASAADIETLGETIRQRVRETSGHDLHWEIKRVGQR